MGQVMRRTAPEVITGYELGECEFGYFTIVKNREGINLIKNSGFEYPPDTDVNWAVTNATLTIDGYPYRGFYGAKVTHTNLALRSYIKYLSAASAGLMYWFSAYVFATKGEKFHISVRSAAEAQIIEKPFTGKGYYQRVFINFIPSASTTYYFCVERDAGQKAGYFTADDFQLEQSDVLTTYIDGSLGSLTYRVNDYKWNGISSNSTSKREPFANSGGEETTFKELGYYLYGVQGLGFPEVENIFSDLSTGGSMYQGTRVDTRQFTLDLAVYGTSVDNIRNKKHDINQIFSPTRSYMDQPLLLKFHKPDSGKVIKIPAHYVSGLTGNVDNYYQERIALTFEQSQPLIEVEGVTRATGTAIASVTSRGILRRNGTTGVWENIGTMTVGSVYDIKQGPDGKIYVCGSFTSINGNPALDYFARVDPESLVWEGFAALGNTARAMTFVGSTVVVVGDFTNVSGIAASDYIVMRNVYAAPAGNWSTTVTPDGIVYDIDCMPGSSWVYFTGAFLNINANPTERFGSYNVAAGTYVTYVTTGIANTGKNVAIRRRLQTTSGPLVDIFVSYQDAAAPNYNHVRRFPNSAGAWGEIFATNYPISDLAIDQNNYDLLACGYFTRADTAGGIFGISPYISGILRYKSGGQLYEAVPGVVTDVSTNVSNLVTVNGSPTILFSGSYSVTGFTGLTGITGYRNGAIFDVGVQVEGKLFVSGSSIYVGTGSTPATPIGVPYPVSVNNNGTQESMPYFKITAGATASVIYGIRSIFDDTIFIMSGYTLSPGDYLYVDFRERVTAMGSTGDNILITNSFGESLWYLKMPGTVPIRMAPGANKFEVMKTGGDVTLEVFWNERYSSIEDV